MARNRKPGKPMIRRRVTWESGVLGYVEILEDTFTRTVEYCVTCGKQGTWAAVAPNGSPDDSDGRRVCTHCGTILRLSMTPELGEGFDYDSHWGPITRQLQLAETAAEGRR